VIAPRRAAHEQALALEQADDTGMPAASSSTQSPIVGRASGGNWNQRPARCNSTSPPSKTTVSDRAARRTPGGHAVALVVGDLPGEKRLPAQPDQGQPPDSDTRQSCISTGR
jgi:hypothetical protein